MVDLCGLGEMELENRFNNNSNHSSNNNLSSTTNVPLLATHDLHLLNCGICHNSYCKPKLLPCLHTFCESCLSDYIPEQSLSVTCPVCRQQSILPIDGVSALQANIFINSIMDVVGSDCNTSSACQNGGEMEKQESSDIAKSKPAVNKFGGMLEMLRHIPKISQCTQHLLVGTEKCGECGGESVRTCSRCSTCEKPLCETCASQHQDKHEDHVITEVPELSNNHVSEDVCTSNLVCTNHAGNPLQFYCTSCETGVCETCTTSEHVSHTVISLQDAVGEHKSSLATLMSAAREQIPTLHEAINNITEVEQVLASQTEVAEGKITEAFDELVKLMNERKSTLLKDLSNVYNKKKEVLTHQKEHLESVVNKINNSCDFTEETLSHGSSSEILLVRKEMSQKLHDLSTSVVRKEPEENEYVSFDTAHCQGLKKSVGTLGYIRHNCAVAYNTTATGEGLRHAIVNKPAVITISTKDKNGELVKTSHSLVDSELTASNGDRIIPAITDQQNGTYELVYLLPREDDYSMFIKLFGRQIKGSPFKVKAMKASIDGHGDSASSTSKIPRTAAVKQKGTKRPSSSRSGSNRKSNVIEDDLLWKVGVKGRNKGEFTNPQGICCTENRILVTDSNNQVAQVFNFSGECKLKFGMPGRVAGKMQRPTGVAITLNGNFLIADYDNKWISVFAPDGRYLNKIGTGKLLGPKGVAVDRNGNIVVVDNKASSVLIFQPNGKLVTKFGSRGNGDSQFAGPHYVAVNAANDLIVSDFHNHCIKVFDCEGNFLFGFGSNGEGNGQFNAPTGVAVDDYGNILVADWGNSRIQVFDSNGSFLSYVNTTADPLYGPQGLAITPEGTVVVSDSGNHCIKMYKYLQ
ncbi:tripartite motif-containing protein 3-like isoform X2 [Mya arenaria]|uniref:tripartite motif-containing protein 3-like isoform X2 n=1 Tax=Mya arenaria TaxID=6604 RepID=UPI0022DF3CF3|nr:tripartite motif-containing protein 3-like isoform X2 [Mya arenaria]